MKFWLRSIFGAFTALLLAGVAHAQQLSIESVSATPGSAKPGEAVTFNVAVNNNGATAFNATDTANFSITLTNVTTGYSFVVTANNVTPKALIPPATSGSATSPATPGRSSRTL